jgi:hypothetical protein
VNTYMQDYATGPLGAGGQVISGTEGSRDTVLWAGDFLDDREAACLPASTVYHPANSGPEPQPMAPVLPYSARQAGTPSKQGVKTVGIMFAVLAGFVALIAGGLFYDRQTRPLAQHWFACPVASPQRFDLPLESGKIELDPHLPQGGVNYAIRVLSSQGDVIASKKDWLDMHPKRKTLSLAVAPAARSIEVECSLSVPVAGLRSWPVELRVLR